MNSPSGNTTTGENEPSGAMIAGDAMANPSPVSGGDATKTCSPMTRGETMTTYGAMDSSDTTTNPGPMNGDDAMTNRSPMGADDTMTTCGAMTNCDTTAKPGPMSNRDATTAHDAVPSSDATTNCRGITVDHGLPRALPLLLASVLSACSLAPAHVRPDSPVPQRWAYDTSAQQHDGAAGHWVDDTQWQDFVTDPVLRQLIDTALRHNRDLRQAVLAIEMARAQYRVQRAERAPQFAQDAAQTRQRAPDAGSGAPSSVINENAEVQIALGAFELDLFGRLKNLSDAARGEYLATEQEQRAVRIALIADLCATYVDYQGAGERKALVTATLASRQRSLELVQASRRAGIASELDVHEATALVAEADVQLQQARRAQARAANALHWLLGTADEATQLPSLPVSAASLFRPLQPGLSSDLIARRPEILAAEQRLRARNADIGAARAAFFPRLTLTGAYGSSSGELTDLFRTGTKSWSFLPRLSLPLFSGGALRASLDLAELRRDSAIAAYEKNIQDSFREVADALAQQDTLTAEATAQSTAHAASRKAAELAQLRYRAGVDSHLRYLDAERQALASELALLDVRLQLQQAQAALFKALGGGWIEGEAPAQAVAAATEATGAR